MDSSHTSEWAERYWKSHLRLMLVLLSLWFLVSLGAGVLFVDSLNQIRIGGFKLGFWFAQQGSIYSFVLLIWIYVYRMNQLDRAYGMDEDESTDDPQLEEKS